MNIESKALDSLSRRIIDIENHIGIPINEVNKLAENATLLDVIYKINELIEVLNLKLR